MFSKTRCERDIRDRSGQAGSKDEISLVRITMTGVCMSEREREREEERLEEEKRKSEKEDEGVRSQIEVTVKLVA